MNKQIESIHYLVSEGHYGLKLAVVLVEGQCLYFDSSRFSLVDNKEFVMDPSWVELAYEKQEKQISLVEIKEDEAVAYFIKFSNNDILYIYQSMNGLEDWFQDFKNISPRDSIYNKVVAHMHEEWIETNSFLNERM